MACSGITARWELDVRALNVGGEEATRFAEKIETILSSTCFVAVPPDQLMRSPWPRPPIGFALVAAT